jgi:hypothetical protein
MNTYPYLFNQSPEQLRRIGARGGKAQARNRRRRPRALPYRRLRLSCVLGMLSSLEVKVLRPT